MVHTSKYGEWNEVRSGSCYLQFWHRCGRHRYRWHNPTVGNDWEDWGRWTTPFDCVSGFVDFFWRYASWGSHQQPTYVDCAIPCPNDQLGPVLVSPQVLSFSSPLFSCLPARLSCWRHWWLDWQQHLTGHSQDRLFYRSFDVNAVIVLDHRLFQRECLEACVSLQDKLLESSQRVTTITDMTNALNRKTMGMPVFDDRCFLPPCFFFADGTSYPDEYTYYLLIHSSFN